MNNPSLKEQIYSSILNSIISGEISPDQVLNEKSLMEQYNVSRAPIREALIALCSDHVLYSIPYYGYKVSPLTQEDINNTKSFRSVLECGFMYEKWDCFTRSAIAEIETVYENEKKVHSANDALTHWNSNMRFHLSLFSVYGNQYAYESLEAALQLQTRAYAQNKWEEWHSLIFDDTPPFHGLILDAIKQGAKSEAIKLLKTDIINIL